MLIIKILEKHNRIKFKEDASINYVEDNLQPFTPAESAALNRNYQKLVKTTDQAEQSNNLGPVALGYIFKHRLNNYIGDLGAEKLQLLQNLSQKIQADAKEFKTDPNSAFNEFCSIINNSRLDSATAIDLVDNLQIIITKSVGSN
jgi:hypothetical protein